MTQESEPTIVAASAPGEAVVFLAKGSQDQARGNASQASLEGKCFHCGTPCRTSAFVSHEKNFCCLGCQTVFELLTENGLTTFYKLTDQAGVRIRHATRAAQYQYLDEPSVRERLADFANERSTRVTLRLPAIHCIACVWLLENLFRLKPGIGASSVDFPRKHIVITFDHSTIPLSEVAALLASLGYEPELRLSDLEGRVSQRVSRRLWLQLAIAGFAFGNIMLFSISSYLGLDGFQGSALKHVFGYLSLLLCLPVVTYSALDYWRSAWVSLRERVLTLEVPIALGIAAIFVQSTYAVLSGAGVGYFDSLAGLLFFLLCGRLFQQKTFERLSFDRDYQSFFPLSVTRQTSGKEETISIAQVAVGDRLVLRNGELIPADARLASDGALIDYSFVTGESEPVEKRTGDHLYAGGRLVGAIIEIETVKAPSQSYLTSLWNQDAFHKIAQEPLDSLTDRYSRRFTKIVLALAVSAAVFWVFRDSATSVKAFTSILIVACPCALALAAPFTLGTAQRILARRNIYLKNSNVVEKLARVDAVVFDKTGTLTAAGAGSAGFRGRPLSDEEQHWLQSLTRHSTHPSAVRIGKALASDGPPAHVRSFVETAGCGIEGSVTGRELWLGSATWLEARAVTTTLTDFPISGSQVHLAINGAYRGCFVLTSAPRPETRTLLARLAPQYPLALLSGDNEKEKGSFQTLFGPDARLCFNQRPLDKLLFIESLQQRGHTVMMVGDGLNDAGALKQSDVGIAVSEKIGAFTPASDIILAASEVGQLAAVLAFSKRTVAIVRAAFFVSALYNIVGLTIAARGELSPLVCAILMPLSSTTVVIFACGLTRWAGWRAGLGTTAQHPNSTIPSRPQSLALMQEVAS